MKRFSYYCNLFWMLFSLVVGVEAWRLGIGDINTPGAGFFPFFTAVVMLVFSVIAFSYSMRTKSASESSENQERFRWWNVVLIVAATLAFALSLTKIGFLINTFLFITLMLKVVEPQSWKTAILGGLITAITANVVFNVIFRANLPSGIIGF